jgi:hypothetical protein
MADNLTGKVFPISFSFPSPTVDLHPIVALNVSFPKSGIGAAKTSPFLSTEMKNCNDMSEVEYFMLLWPLRRLGSWEGKGDNMEILFPAFKDSFGLLHQSVGHFVWPAL